MQAQDKAFESRRRVAVTSSPSATTAFPRRNGTFVINCTRVPSFSSISPKARGKSSGADRNNGTFLNADSELRSNRRQSATRALAFSAGQSAGNGMVDALTGKLHPPLFPVYASTHRSRRNGLVRARLLVTRLPASSALPASGSDRTSRDRSRDSHAPRFCGSARGE